MAIRKARAGRQSFVGNVPGLGSCAGSAISACVMRADKADWQSTIVNVAFDGIRVESMANGEGRSDQRCDHKKDFACSSSLSVEGKSGVCPRDHPS